MLDVKSFPNPKNKPFQYVDAHVRTHTYTQFAGARKFMIGFSISTQGMHTDQIMIAEAVKGANCSMCQAGTYQTRSGPNESALGSGMELLAFTYTLHSFKLPHNSAL